ncbi:MAG: phosphohydrolase [Ferruginibacter sp.]|nr:phosphohydrolase [Ferruginibacter sp.]
MEMNYGLIEEQVKQYVLSYFAVNGKKRLFYHDLKHTETVVASVKQISAHYQLNEQDHFIAVAAAWFHDMAYCMAGEANMHELKSAALAGEFLKEKGVDDSIVTAIKNCVLATKMPQHPTTLVEQILCDADLFNLGTDDFSTRNKLMRKEYEATSNTHVSKEEWRKGTIKLLQSHHYHTDYCQDLLNKKKQENLEKLLQKENGLAPKNEVVKPGKEKIKEEKSIKEEKLIKEEKPNKEVPALKKEERPVRGIETMFRIAVTNHQRLSDMADSKANIMISVNSIIISVVIALVVRKLETTPALIIPTLILLGGCVTAAIFSVLATRPKIPDGYFTPEQLSGKTVNLLFFGNFYNMDYDHYYEGMKRVMEDSEFLYASLIRDIYSQGKVLGNKYKLLRISYTVFMFTLILSILAFGIATLF